MFDISSLTALDRFWSVCVCVRSVFVMAQRGVTRLTSAHWSMFMDGNRYTNAERDTLGTS
jgi:hypothetical protein